MLFPDRVSRLRFPIRLFHAVACFSLLWFTGSSSGQQTAPGTPPPSPSETAKHTIDRAEKAGTRPAEAPPLLQQLNTSIEQLTARISPAVVQIVVNGYGALEDNSRSQTALITREHVIGSGVIVDPNGYIITNATWSKGLNAFTSLCRCLP